jgi:CheY-like chemotaxis protein/two-component sensor histidine kinase
MQEQVSEIRKAAEQANSLTRQLLAFSRRQPIQPVLLDLNELATRMSEVLRRVLRDDIELTILTDSGLGMIRCDRGQIEQAIMNLGLNAAEAMPNGGKLVIAATNVCLEESYARLHPGVQPGPYVRLMVKDNGKGMAPETRARIFEPFFTTRKHGKGVGLGLAAVYGGVKQANAHITVESEPTKGTTFTIYFPRIEKAAARDHQIETLLPDDSETVLVVDDQEGLRTLLTEVMRSKGYRVLAAGNGLEALRLASEHPGRIDLIVTDMVMPRMGGCELVLALSRSRPETRILCMSGYTDRDEDISTVLSAGHSFIEKPFTTEAFLDKVREILDVPVHSADKERLRQSG